MKEIIVNEPVWEVDEAGVRRLVVGAGARLTETEAKRLGIKHTEPAEDKAAAKEPPADKAKVTSSRSSKK